MGFTLTLIFSNGSQVSYILPMVKYLQRKGNTKKASFVFYGPSVIEKTAKQTNKKKYTKQVSLKENCTLSELEESTPSIKIGSSPSWLSPPNGDFKTSSPPHLFAPPSPINKTTLTRHHIQVPRSPSSPRQTLVPPDKPLCQVIYWSPGQTNFIHVSIDTPTNRLNCTFSKSLTNNQANIT